MSTSTPRTPYHHGDLRNALLDAAAAAAEEVGAEALSLRDVARRAGVSHTAAYNHFQDKNDLLRALAVQAFGEFADALQRATGPTVGSLEDMGVAYLRFAWEHAGVFRFMFQKSLCMPQGEFDPLEEAGRASHEVLRTTIAELQRKGVLVPGDTDLMALVVWSQVHGITALVLETPGFKSVTIEVAESLMRQNVRALCGGIAAAPA